MHGIYTINLLVVLRTWLSKVYSGCGRHNRTSGTRSCSRYNSNSINTGNNGRSNSRSNICSK